MSPLWHLKPRGESSGFMARVAGKAGSLSKRASVYTRHNASSSESTGPEQAGPPGTKSRAREAGLTEKRCWCKRESGSRPPVTWWAAHLPGGKHSWHHTWGRAIPGDSFLKSTVISNAAFWRALLQIADFLKPPHNEWKHENLPAGIWKVFLWWLSHYPWPIACVLEGVSAHRLTSCKDGDSPVDRLRLSWVAGHFKFPINIAGHSLTFKWNTEIWATGTN